VSIRLPTRALLPALFLRLPLALVCATTHAQAPTTAPAATPAAARPPAAKPATAHKARTKPVRAALDSSLILLDPAHGGSDNGAPLTDGALEKDVTTAFAAVLKSALSAAGFTVQLTHASASDELTPDQRAEAANRTRASACLLLHASNAGHGVHLFTSSLPPSSFGSDELTSVLAWDAAQAASLRQSQRLAGSFADAFRAARIPLVVASISVPPIDSLTCPAIALELSPTAGDAVTSTTYQQHIAESVLVALNDWRRSLDADNSAAQAARATPANPAATRSPATKPSAKPATPKPAARKVIPEETPDIISAPAPVKRVPKTTLPPPASPPQ
jgi:N-acetylmuramoyl-L-alanine amidase